MRSEATRPSRGFFAGALISGLLIVVPFYLAVLLLLKAMQSLVGVVRPIAALLPEWIPAEDLLSLLLVLVLCFLVGVAVRTRIGQAARERIEKSLFQRIPGYGVFRGLAEQMSGESRESAWKPALVETGDGLVPGFIIEELDDGQLTVFVPSVPTPFAGAVLVLARERVHALDVPFTSAIQVVSKWGSGAKALVAAMNATKR
jgi:uncharacterized membrane protein